MSADSTIVSRPLPPPVVCVVPAPRFDRARGGREAGGGVFQGAFGGYSDGEHRPFGS